MNRIELDNKEIIYQLKNSNRKTLGLEIDHSGSLIVTAPEYIPISKIEDVIRGKKTWILEKIAEKKANFLIQPSRKFVSGESIYIFGRQYFLKVEFGDHEGIVLAHNRVVLTVKDEQYAAQFMAEWLDQQLEKEIQSLWTKCLGRFVAITDTTVKPKYRIHPMKNRWGSCTASGLITLNSKLISATIECIEYVILHELAHLVHFDHDEDFHDTLMALCPNYKILKKKLDENTVLFE